MLINFNADVRKLSCDISRMTLSPTSISGSNLVDKFYSLEIQRIAEDSKFFGQVIIQRMNLKIGDWEPLPTTQQVVPYSTYDSYTLKFGEKGQSNSEFNDYFPKFYTSQVNVDEITGIYSITAYDKLYQVKDLTVADLNITAPYTVEEFANAIGHKVKSNTDCSFINIDSSLLAISYPIGANLEETDTIKDCLSYLAELLNAVCYLNNSNQLVFKRLDKDGESLYTIEKASQISLKSGDSKRFGKIVFATELGDNIEAETQQTGSTQVFRNNAFIDNYADKAALAEQMITDLGGLTIGCFDLIWRGNLDYNIGDKLSIRLKDDSLLTTYLLDEVITFDGALQSELKFTWDINKDSDISANPTTLSETIYDTYAKVDKVNKAITLVASSVATNTQNINGITSDLLSVSNRVESTESNISELQITTSSINASVAANTSSISTITTSTIPALQSSISSIEIGGRNLFIAATRTNDYYYNASLEFVSYNRTVTSDYIPVNEGEEYIYQIWQPESSYTGAHRTFRAMTFFDADKVALSRDFTYTTLTHNVKYFTIPTGAKYMRITMRMNALGTSGESWNPYGDFKVKVEKGNKPTEWSIAPEDVNTSITGIRTDLTTTQSQVTTNTSNISSLSIAASSIAARVGTTESSLTEITTTTLPAFSNSITTINSQVATNTSNISDLTIGASAITLSVSNLITSLASTNTTVSTLSDNFNNLEIGGRNLIKYGDSTKTGTVPSSSSIANTQAYYTWSYGTDLINNYLSDYYVFQGDYEVSGNENTQANFYPQVNSVQAGAANSVNVYDNPTGHFEDVIKIPSSLQSAHTSWYFRLRLRSATAGTTIAVKNVKVEKGSKATTFTLAPEDIDEDISAVSSSLASTITRVGSLEVSASSIAARVGTTETAISNLQTDAQDRYAELALTDNAIYATVATLQETNSNLKDEIEDVADTMTTQFNSVTQQLATKVTASDITIAINNVVNDGVNKVTTTTGYKLDNDGLTIAKSNSNIATNIDNEGMIVSKQNEQILTATTAGVNAIDLTARNYLIIGSNSRLQDYGSSKAGIFWIGG